MLMFEYTAVATVTERERESERMRRRGLLANTDRARDYHDKLLVAHR